MLRTLLLLLLVMPLSIDNAAAQAPNPGTVTGTVTYRHRMTLPPDAIVEVQLQDTSRTDAAARTVGVATIATAGAQVPIPFRIDCDPAVIDPSHSYSVGATISVGGKVLFRSPTMYPVLTRGAGNTAAIDVYMIMPSGPATGKAVPAAAPVANTQ